MNPRVRHVLISISIVVVVLILAGATYQGVATALERRRYPHPGQLVDVGGHQLHIYCRGEGRPTVVLEASEASMSAAWGWVQPEVAKTTRTCSYDRAGLGWSEAGDKPYDPGRVPEELHALLAAAKEPGPYVLVGYDLGASFARRFASLYPADTLRIVHVEAPRRAAAITRFDSALPWLARAGLLRATGLLSGEWKGLPPMSSGAVSTFLNRPDHLTRASREIARYRDAVRLGEDARVPAHVEETTVTGPLNDEAAASQVASAIVESVRRSRRR